MLQASVKDSKAEPINSRKLYYGVSFGCVCVCGGGGGVLDKTITLRPKPWESLEQFSANSETSKASFRVVIWALGLS